MRKRCTFRSVFCGLIAVVALLFGLWTLKEEFVGDFSAANLRYEALPDDLKGQIPLLSLAQEQAVSRLFAQKFVWLGQGHQVYAFESQDQQYVLKVFKFRRLQPSYFLQLLSYPPWCHSYYVKQERKRQRRLQKLFEGYQIAYGIDKEHTGMLYIHLHRTDDLKRKIRVVDRMGGEHELDLDHLTFAIQKKGRITKEVLSDLLDRGEVAIAQARLLSLFDLYEAEYALGVIDHDHNILLNTGFIGERPVHLDVGQLHYDPAIKEPHHYNRDLKKIVFKRLTPWLEKHYPQFSPQLTEAMENRLADISKTKM
jgi:hypothetical protein